MNAAEKSPDAFRTIGEVSIDLAIPQHILRFWESKFPQLKPVKRSGNRRYYRPEDVALVQRIDQLLNREGYTIAGVQRLLKLRASEGQGEPAVIPEVTGLQPADKAGDGAVGESPSHISRFDRAALQTIRDLLADALERTRAA